VRPSKGAAFVYLGYSVSGGRLDEQLTKPLEL
jgi:hypothetical protein